MALDFCVRYCFDLNIVGAVINKRFHQEFPRFNIRFCNEFNSLPAPLGFELTNIAYIKFPFKQVNMTVLII